MFRFACPNCKTVLQSPAQKAGDMALCPKCGQSVLIPNPVKPAARNESVLPPIPAQHKPATNQPEPSLAVHLEEEQDAEGKPIGEKRAIRKRRSKRRSAGAIGCGLLGVFLCMVGCGITLVYWLVYNTTVYDTVLYERIHNTGLMNNRIVGTIAGVGMALGGLIILLGYDLANSILGYLQDREDNEL